MNVLVITVFASLLLVVAGLVLFVSRIKAGDFDHGDRLSLLPLEDDEIVRQADGPANAPEEAPGASARIHETKRRKA